MDDDEQMLTIRFDDDTKWDKCAIIQLGSVSLSENDRRILDIIGNCDHITCECHTVDCDNGGYCDLYPDKNFTVVFEVVFNEPFYRTYDKKNIELHKEIPSVQDLIFFSKDDKLAVTGKADSRQLQTWLKKNGESVYLIEK